MEHICGNAQAKKIEILFNVFRTRIVNAPWYIRTSELHRDLGVNTVKTEIKNIATKHNNRLRRH